MKSSSPNQGAARARSPFSWAGLVVWLVLLASLSAQAADHSFISNGVRLRYAVQGQGQPVVLIHGMTLDTESQWDAAGTRKALAKDYQVIAFDCRGHGTSDKPHAAAAYGLEMVEDVCRLLDALHLTKAHLVGYSLGSSIALKFLTLHPERCLSAVLGECAVYREGYDFSAEEKAARTTALVSAPAQVMPEPPPGAPTEVVQRRNAWVAMPHDFTAYAAVFQSLSALQVNEAALRSNQVPVLGLFCQTNARADYLTQHLSNFKARFIGGSHQDAFLRPEFTAQVKAFLQAQTGQSYRPGAVGGTNAHSSSASR